MRRESNHVLRSLSLVAVLALGFSLTFVSFLSKNVAAPLPQPIRIEYNAGFTAANGVTGGSGTAQDPYVIEGLNPVSIIITNTTSHVILRGLYLTGHQANIWVGGGLILVNVTNCTVEHCWKAAVGGEDFTAVLLEDCSNITILSCRVDSVFEVVGSRNVTIESTLVRYNAIDIDSSTNVTVSQCIFCNSMKESDSVAGGAIWLRQSRCVVIANNYIFNGITGFTSGGIRLGSSTAILVYGNFLINNTVQATDSFGPENSWNLTYPEGGNYWSDYHGSDLYSGPSQDVPGSDGIGDTPYVIDGNSSDSFPLYRPTIPNVPPMAFFFVVPTRGYSIIPFGVDASGSYDCENGTGVQVRWSWEDDGIWTDWTTVKTAEHVYATPGVHTIELEVRDPQGMVNSTEMQVLVMSLPVPEFGVTLVPVIGLPIVVIVARRRKSGLA